MERGLVGVMAGMMYNIATKAIGIDMPQCKFCQSYDVVKNGTRNGVQYYLCKECGRGFVYNKGLPKMRYPVDIVADAVYDYYAGVSLNKIRDGIHQKIGRKPADSAIYGWVKKLTKIALAEAKKHTPQVGGKWVADECVLKLKDGRKYWLINIIDYDTRFLLASKLSRNRGIVDTREALETAQRKANRSPVVLLTDGWQAYRAACRGHTVHVHSSPFVKKGLSTNIVERWHGTLKDRLKPMRGMDKSETYQLILEGFVLNYNYLRPHESLGGRTPAEVAKIDFPHKSWLDVIKSQIPKPPSKRSRTIEEMMHPFKPYRKRTKPKVKRKQATKRVLHHMVHVGRA